MNTIKRFLSCLLCVLPITAMADTPVATTAGSNLTAYNSNNSLSNNNWAVLTNPRTQAISGANGANNAKADFGNCNAVILRCAQPKCSGTGCTDESIASMIVMGCIQANAACQQYADQGLTEYIVAQLVASSMNKANQAALDAQNSAAAAAAEQNAQQLQQMQYQMQQMQSEMAAQNAQTIAQLQSALDEQKQMTEDALAKAAEAITAAPSVAPSSATTTTSAVAPVTAAGELTDAQQIAVANNISADILVREQINGQILSGIENAEVAMQTLKQVMGDAFTYAGCDSKGNNCSGPKRVKTFKDKAMKFFEPYDAVYDELEDALIMAQAVGVDINDIYMMMNDACNVWGQYACSGQNGYQVKFYNNSNCSSGTSKNSGGGDDIVRGGLGCMPSQAIPPEDDVRCTLVKQLSNAEKDENVKWDFLNPETSDDGDDKTKVSKNMVRVGCASSRLAIIPGRRRTAKSSVDIGTLERIIEQDAPDIISKGMQGKGVEHTSYCGVANDETVTELEKYVSGKTLPNTICVKSESQLKDRAEQQEASGALGGGSALLSCVEKCDILHSGCSSVTSDDDDKCIAAYDKCVYACGIK